MTPLATGNPSEASETKPVTNELEVTKYSLRKEIWTTFDKNGLVTFPRPVRGRIPNFQGAGEAADKLKGTEAFQKATLIKVNADKPQETVRVHALEAKEKRLVVSPRRGDTHPLLEIKLPEPPIAGTEPSAAVLRAAVTRQGMLTFCHPIAEDQASKIDMIVVGSVAVSRRGQRIGKCDGFSDLEFGYLSEIGAITEETIIATTVHDSQVFDTLPEELFREHDFPVDLIVTPTEVIEISPRANRPRGIIWKLLSNRRMALSPNVSALHKKRVEEGQEVHLKEEDTDEETEKDIRRKHRPFIYRHPRRPHGEIKDGKPRRSSTRRPRTNTENGAESATDGEGRKEPMKRSPPRRRFWKRQRILFTIRIGGIASTDRVRDLKNALAKRNVRPAEIAWFGRRGFAYVHFAKPRTSVEEPETPIELETVVASLKDMTLGEDVEGKEKTPVVVEPAAKREDPSPKREDSAAKKEDLDKSKLDNAETPSAEPPTSKLQEIKILSASAEKLVVPPVEPSAATVA